MTSAPYLVLLIVCLTLLCCSCTQNTGNSARQGPVYQAGTLAALQNGTLNGDETFADLEKHGDFGLGTFNGLDGEMVALDGEFYQVRTDGAPHEVSGSVETPFAVVLQFEPGAGKPAQLPAGPTVDELKAELDRILSTRNDFVAVRERLSIPQFTWTLSCRVMRISTRRPSTNRL